MKINEYLKKKIFQVCFLYILLVQNGLVLENLLKVLYHKSLVHYVSKNKDTMTSYKYIQLRNLMSVNKHGSHKIAMIKGPISV